MQIEGVQSNWNLIETVKTSAGLAAHLPQLEAPDQVVDALLGSHGMSPNSGCNTYPVTALKFA